jgi:hypothetical protein
MICEDNAFGVNCSESYGKKTSNGLPNYLKMCIGGGAILVIAIIIFAFSFIRYVIRK